MDEFDFDDVRPTAQFSLRSMLGVHGAAAAVCEVASEAPVLAAVVGAIGAFVLLQAGVVAACTWRLPVADA
jgi:hypothetical protein